MKKKTTPLHVGIVGASGAVGREILKLLESTTTSISKISCFTSSSPKQSLLFKEQEIEVKTLCEESFENLDVVFFCAGSEVSKKYVQAAIDQNVLVIDNSSAFRSSSTIPLVIPEINPETVSSQTRVIANPNCVVILLLMALYPLTKIAPLKRLVLSTYQAASGAGYRVLQGLQEETLAYLKGTSYERSPSPYPYAFNAFLHPSEEDKDQYSGEERKVIDETRKILQKPHLPISVTCVRIPVLRAHCISVNAEFDRNLPPEEAIRALEATPGIQIASDPYAMPRSVSGQKEVFCSRIRKDLSNPNTLDLWVAGDQLLKGAALNAVQIMEFMYKK